MVSSLDKVMHQVRSARGADCDVEARKKARAALDEDIADATALLRVAKRTGVDSTRLSEKLEAARKLMGKDGLQIEAVSTGNGSVTSNLPGTQEPRLPENPPQHTHIKQAVQNRRDDDAVSLRSSVAARNADEILRREKEIRRRDEDSELKRRMEAVQREARRQVEAVELEMLKVKHHREEADAEEEDERRSVISNGGDRVEGWLDSNASLGDVSPPLSPRYMRSPSASYRSSPAPSAAGDAASRTESRPIPKPRASLSRVFPH